MLVVGIIAVVILVIHIAGNIYLKHAGQKFTLDYMEESEYCSRTDEKQDLTVTMDMHQLYGVRVILLIQLCFIQEDMVK